MSVAAVPDLSLPWFVYSQKRPATCQKNLKIFPERWCAVRIVFSSPHSSTTPLPPRPPRHTVLAIDRMRDPALTVSHSKPRGSFAPTASSPGTPRDLLTARCLLRSGEPWAAGPHGVAVALIQRTSSKPTFPRARCLGGDTVSRMCRDVLILQLADSFTPIAPQPLAEVQFSLVVRGLKTDGAAGCCSPVRVAVLHGHPVRSSEID